MRRLVMVLLLGLASCATPVTTMEKGTIVINCGGGTAGSFFGGFLGYTIQEGHDHDCVAQHASNGYKIVTPQQ